MINPQVLRRLLALSLLITLYGAVFLVCHWIEARAAVRILLAVLAGNLLYSAFYFINEFRHDQVISGRATLASAARVQSRRRYMTWYWVVLVNISQLFVFSLLFHYNYQLGGSDYFTYSRQITYVDWLLYTVDCTFKSLLDIPEIFDLHLRDIQHHGLIGASLVASVRLLIYGLLVAAVMRRWNRWLLVRQTVAAANNAPRLAGPRLVRMGEDALPALQSALRKPGSFDLNHEGMDKLIRNEHSKPLVELLLRNLSVGNEHERKNAAALLGLLAFQDDSRLPYFARLIQTAAQDPELAVRVETIDALLRIKDRRVLKPLRALLGDPQPAVRMHAARVLGLRGDVRAICRLAPLLEDPVSDVRVATVRALGRIGHRGALSQLQSALNNLDPLVRQEAVFSLAHLRHTPVGPMLLQFLAHENPEIRAETIECVEILRPEGAAEALAPLLTDEMAGIRCQATRILGNLDPQRAADAFLAAPRDVDPLVRRAQISVLADLNQHACVPFLAEATQDRDALVRERAIECLAELHSEQAVQALSDALESAELEDQLHTIRAMGESRQPGAYPPLLEIARAHANVHLRRLAIRALSWIDPARAGADVHSLLQDADVHEEAVEALNRIGSGSWALETG